MFTMLYSKVSRSELNCMRRECCCMMKHHARMHGYTMNRMYFPSGDQATWYCSMCKNGKMKEMMMRVYRDPVTGKLMMQCSQDMMSNEEMKQMMNKMHHKC